MLPWLADVSRGTPVFPAPRSSFVCDPWNTLSVPAHRLREGNAPDELVVSGLTSRYRQLPPARTKTQHSALGAFSPLLRLQGP